MDKEFLEAERQLNQFASGLGLDIKNEIAISVFIAKMLIMHIKLTIWICIIVILCAIIYLTL